MTRPVDQLTFTSRTTRVRLDVSVVGPGAQPIRGLAAADFDVRDRGARQVIEVEGLDDSPVTVMLALDLSGSVRGETLRQLRRAADTVAAALEPRDRLGLALFASGIVIVPPAPPDRAALAAAMDAEFAVGDTSLIDATFAAMNVVERLGTPRIVVVFSDGQDTSSFLPAAAVLEGAKRSSTVVCAVSTRRRGANAYLDDLAAATGGESVNVARIDDVAASFEALLARYRQGYLASYQPTDAAAGWHDVSVRVRRPGARVFVRPGYTVRGEP
jgi:VWFA-related protein